MRASRGIPAVTVDRRMNLAPLIEARKAALVRPAWTVIVAKAFAMVAAETPALRTSYISFPWPHLCEHSDPVVSITLEREHHGEEAVFIFPIRRPHALSLKELDALLRDAKELPVENVAPFRRALSFARVPWPMRGWLMRLALHMSGRWRERFFGTFSATSPASAGAGGLHLISPLACAIHYGMFDEQGRLDVRLTFDHRVLDGAAAARALVGVERVLSGVILDELRQLSRPSVAA